jgi:hypothetical protein
MSSTKHTSANIEISTKSSSRETFSCFFLIAAVSFSIAGIKQSMATEGTDKEKTITQ